MIFCFTVGQHNYFMTSVTVLYELPLVAVLSINYLSTKYNVVFIRAVSVDSLNGGFFTWSFSAVGWSDKKK